LVRDSWYDGKLVDNFNTKAFKKPAESGSGGRYIRRTRAAELKTG